MIFFNWKISSIKYVHKNFKIFKPKNILTFIYICRFFKFFYIYILLLFSIFHIQLLPWLICLALLVVVFYNLINNILISLEISICSCFLQCFSFCLTQYFGVRYSSVYYNIAKTVFQYAIHTFHYFLSSSNWHDNINICLLWYI